MIDIRKRIPTGVRMMTLCDNFFCYLGGIDKNAAVIWYLWLLWAIHSCWLVLRD